MIFSDRKIALAVICFISFLHAHSQEHDFKWVSTIRSQSSPKLIFNPTAHNFVFDPEGNIYLVGSFEGTISFGNGKFTLQAQDVKNKHENYIAKFDSSGNILWAKDIGRSRYDGRILIDIDSKGNLHIAGVFSGKVDFDPGADTFMAVAKYTEDMFLLTLDRNGEFKNLLSYNGSSTPRGIEVDLYDNIILQGQSGKEEDFDPGPGVAKLSGNSQRFIFKLSSSGTLAWLKEFPYLVISSLGIDSSGNVYLNGSFPPNGPLDFDPGPGVYTLTNINTVTFSHFVLKLDSSGNFVWVRKVGGARDNYGTSFLTFMAVEKSGDLLITGYFEDKQDFNPGTDTFYLTGLPNDNPFWATRYVLKLDHLGNFRWAKRLDGLAGHNGTPVSVDLSGNAYISGSFRGDVDFDPGPGISKITSTKSIIPPNTNYTYSHDVFLLKLDGEGNFMWVNKWGSNSHDAAIEIANGPSGEIYTLGLFSDTTNGSNPIIRDSIDFDHGPGTYQVGGYGTFIHKMSQGSCSNLALVIDSFRNISCAKGSGLISAKVLHGKGLYNYTWNTSPPIKTSKVTPVKAGIYGLEVTDSNGCRRATSVLMSGPSYISGFDVKVNAMAGRIRPGRKVMLQVDALNDGCTAVNSDLKVVLDTLFTYVQAIPPPDEIVGNTLTWKFKLINYEVKPVAPIIYVIPAKSLNSGDSLSVDISISPFGDNNPLNNSKRYRFPVANSFDPNIKSVYPKGECKEKYVLRNKPLTYTIQFQNTGTAEAIDIYILDTLDKNLKINSVRVVGQSHPGLVTEVNKQVIKFKFDNINLPDSSSNEPGSHGYVIFEVFPDSSLSNGTLINGKAGIYFDFNKPVFTNTVINTLTKSINPCQLVGIKSIPGQLVFKIYPNPNNGVFIVEAPNVEEVRVYNIYGKLLFKKHPESEEIIDISTYPDGVYIVEVNAQKLKVLKSQ